MPVISGLLFNDGGCGVAVWEGCSDSVSFGRVHTWAVASVHVRGALTHGAAEVAGEQVVIGTIGRPVGVQCRTFEFFSAQASDCAAEVVRNSKPCHRSPRRSLHVIYH